MGARNDENDDDDVANTMVAIPLSRLVCFKNPFRGLWHERATARLHANKCPAKTTRLLLKRPREACLESGETWAWFEYSC